MATKDRDEGGAGGGGGLVRGQKMPNAILSAQKTTSSDSIDEPGHCRQTADAVGSFK